MSRESSFYSTSSGLYSGLIIYFFTRFINNVFTSHLGDLGYLATAGMLYLFLRKRLKVWAASARRYFEGVKMKFLAWRMKWWQQGLSVAFVLLLLVPPTAVKVVSDFGWNQDGAPNPRRGSRLDRPVGRSATRFGGSGQRGHRSSQQPEY